MSSFELIVRDRPGVLVRVAQVFARRGYNIKAMRVLSIEEGVESRMNIETEDIQRISLIVAQLNKLVDVRSAKALFTHKIEK